MIAKPVGTEQGMGIMGFCYSPYHFVYDINSKAVNKCLRGLGLEIKLSRMKGSLDVGRFLVLDKVSFGGLFSRYVVNPEMVEKLQRLGFFPTSVSCGTYF